MANEKIPAAPRKKVSDCVPALEPTEARAVPGRVLREQRGDPIRIIVGVAQGGVACLEIADRLGVLQGLEPAFHTLKPCRIEVTMPRHCVVLPEQTVPCPVCAVNSAETESFRDGLKEGGFYKYWHDKLGDGPG